MLCFPMLISSLPDANPPPLEHKIEVFVRFYPPSPIFGRFEHIICIFVLGVAPTTLSQMTLVQCCRWGDAATAALNR